MHKKAVEVLVMLEVWYLADRFTDEMSSGEVSPGFAGRGLWSTILTCSSWGMKPSTALDLFAQHELRLIFRKLAQAGIGFGDQNPAPCFRPDSGDRSRGSNRSRTHRRRRGQARDPGRPAAF